MIFDLWCTNDYSGRLEEMIGYCNHCHKHTIHMAKYGNRSNECMCVLAKEEEELHIYLTHGEDT